MSAVEVVKPATCKRCGDPLLGFATSKAGKPMPVVGHVHPNVEQVTVKPAAPFEFHVCITDRTPRQVDATLYEIFVARGNSVIRAQQLRAERDRKTKEHEENSPRRLYGRSVEEIEQQIRDENEWRRKLGAWRSFYEGEFDRRGGWLRYYLVTSSVGHVHREMTCSTCHDTTTFAWLVDLADCDEAQMVDEYGTKACTTCFPNAPTLEGWKRAARAEQAQADSHCPGSGEYVGFADGRKYATCERCGEVVSKTKNGLLRKHKPAITVEVG